VETTASLVSPIQFTASSSAPDIVSATVSPEGQLKLTPSQLKAGEATITIEATDLDGAKRETNFSVMVKSNVEPYAEWQTKFNFIGEEDAAPLGDPDRDGWVNLIEYVLGPIHWHPQRQTQNSRLCPTETSNLLSAKT
jgi:hypothetical protein